MMSQGSEHAVKIVVISDTHGDNRIIDRVIEKEAPFDYLIHCGDAEISLDHYRMATDKYRFLAVQGNCDFTGDLPPILNERILFYNVLITHGHHENVRYGNEDLLRIGMLNHADIILFGHSHVPEIAEDGGILMVNPGSPTYPRGDGRERTYAVLTLNDDYERRASIRKI